MATREQVAELQREVAALRAALRKIDMTAADQTLSVGQAARQMARTARLALLTIRAACIGEQEGA